MDIIYNLAIGALKGLAAAFIFLHIRNMIRNHPFKKNIYRSIGKYIATRSHPEHRVQHSNESDEVKVIAAVMLSNMGAVIKAAQLYPNEKPYSALHEFIQVSGNIRIMDMKTFDVAYNSPAIAKAVQLINDYLDVFYPPVIHEGKMLVSEFTADIVPLELIPIYQINSAMGMSARWNDHIENFEFNRESKQTHLVFSMFIPTPETKTTSSGRG